MQKSLNRAIIHIDRRCLKEQQGHDPKPGTYKPCPDETPLNPSRRSGWPQLNRLVFCCLPPMILDPQGELYPQPNLKVEVVYKYIVVFCATASMTESLLDNLILRRSGRLSCQAFERRVTRLRCRHLALSKFRVIGVGPNTR